jgi:hypothetical protein
MKKITRKLNKIEHHHGIDLTDDDIQHLHTIWEDIGRMEREREEVVRKSVKKAIKNALGK